VPAVEVTVDGGRRRLAPGVARLLVSLTAFGRAVGAEELALVLWGDVDPALARGRLKSALHRLRQALSLEADELVVRDGDVVRLVPDPRWTIDLVDFRRWATGSGEQQLRAFRMVDGLLCQAQFPYHDELARERTVLAAGWSQLARTLLGRGLVAPEEVRLRARHLGLEEFRA
jgi:DNA-binding SARP family transcriptional activator